MCGRYSITLPPEAIRQLFQTYGELPNFPLVYNAAPTQRLPVVRRAKEEGGREIAVMEWGLIPFFSRDGKASYSTINARSETVQEKPTYREAFKRRRCIVPASGYFEWTGPKGDKMPHFFTRADGPGVALGPHESRALENGQSLSWIPEARGQRSRCVVLEDFSDHENDHILLVAGHDFGRLIGGMPIEAQVFESWYLACHPEKLRSDSLIDYSSLFPMITEKSRLDRKRMGLAALTAARKDPTLKMNYSVE